MLFSREILLNGVQWGIGDGHSVKITSDHWIPERPPYMLKPLKPIPNEAIVRCLMDDQMCKWIPETAYAFFNKEMADLIMQVQIRKHRGEDFVRWPHTRNDIYSVRPAYNMVRSNKFFLSRSKRCGGMSSAAVNEERQWKMI
jgi:hypothetical protein